MNDEFRPRKSRLLEMLECYDNERELYITMLEEKVINLEKEKSQLLDDWLKSTEQHSRSMLELALSGCLARPEEPQ